MIEVKNLNLTNYKEVLTLWNDEVGFIYPISEEIFLTRVFKCDFIFSSYIAYVDKKAVGFIVSKINEINQIAWISLIYVSKKYRKQGIGSKLLEKIEKEFREKEIKKIKVGADFDNFFPGIPCDFVNASNTWFEKRNYKMIRYTYDVVSKIDRIKTYEIIDKGFSFRYAKLSESNKVLDLLKSFSQRWYDEGLDAIKNNDFETSYIIGVSKENDSVVAFLRCNQTELNKKPYNITWYQRFKKLSGIGPLGVFSEYRKLGLGKDIISFALNTLKNTKTTDILIDWTGLLEFYQLFGFEVWKSYIYTEKDLN